MTCDVADIAYYEFYNYEQSDYVSFTSASGNEHKCVYYIYTPKDTELDENTPVIAYVTHGGGVADEERVAALGSAASFGTEAIFIIPWTDRPDAVCASLDHAREYLDGIGNFDDISIQGTSSGARAIIRAAQESVNPERDYNFRFANVIAYDPVEETDVTNITGNTEAFKGLAEEGTVIFLQTDTSRDRSGTDIFCNYVAEVYSSYGGTSLVAEINSGGHERKFIKPITHNSIGWAVGEGPLLEDNHYNNEWFYYEDGVKTACTLDEANDILDDARVKKVEEEKQAQPQNPAKPEETPNRTTVDKKRK